jgi:hypothetical protein
MVYIEGACPECNRHFFGEALGIDPNQIWVKCGSPLDTRKNGIPVNKLGSLGVAKYRISPKRYRLE